MTEIWKQCETYPDYIISDHGRMRRLKSASNQPAGKFIKGSFCQRGGHIKLKLKVEGRDVNSFMHTEVLKAFVGPCPEDKTQCAHYDGDPSNNHVSNLRWATAAENTADKVRHGNHRKGNHKFSEEDILDIRAMRERGARYSDIQARYETSKGNLNAILTRKTWAHV